MKYSIGSRLETLFLEKNYNGFYMHFKHAMSITEGSAACMKLVPASFVLDKLILIISLKYRQVSTMHE